MACKYILHSGLNIRLVKTCIHSGGKYRTCRTGWRQPEERRESGEGSGFCETRRWFFLCNIKIERLANENDGFWETHGFWIWRRRCGHCLSQSSFQRSASSAIPSQADKTAAGCSPGRDLSRAGGYILCPVYLFCGGLGFFIDVKCPGWAVARE